MASRASQIAKWFLGPESDKTSGHLGPRWLFLRALGLIFFSAFYSLVFQATGLIGPNGILPANAYLGAVGQSMQGLEKIWFAPSVFWISSTDHALLAVCWIGMVAAILLVLNFWPRAMTAICFICFLSFIATLQDFASYQSDGMLLAAGFLCLFFAPRGWRPRWGELSPPSRACLWLLLWEWFRIYFESGLAKMLGGDPEWRHLTAMYEYYQNGPLPTWIGWYVQQAPHWFHWLTALATLVMELGIVLMLFLPRRLRLICFFIVTPWEIGVILTANYAFLNYLVLALGVLLLDDQFLVKIAPRNWFPKYHVMVAMRAEDSAEQVTSETARAKSLLARAESKTSKMPAPAAQDSSNATASRVESGAIAAIRRFLGAARMTIAGVCLVWIFYATTAQLAWMLFPTLPLPQWPVEAIEPFRIANQYGLFGTMTRGRYEIEFQGSNDGGKTWTAYPFRYKPQAVNQAPGIYAPYQPRFDWNLWFASLGNWRQYQFVVGTEEALLDNSPEVLSLFASDPFPNGPPQEIRAVIWQYWFTNLAVKRQTGDWWSRKLLGLYAPTLIREPDGRFGVIQFPEPLPPRE
ncbi:MAG TPA: lipase maturation factor family protein [Candidatus Limnocylindrales bacterium]|nr:lipase maturation factor family protein [Candidatus Limnocylindrales bacterium]